MLCFVMPYYYHHYILLLFFISYFLYDNIYIYYVILYILSYSVYIYIFSLQQGRSQWLHSQITTGHRVAERSYVALATTEASDGCWFCGEQRGDSSVQNPCCLMISSGIILPFIYGGLYPRTGNPYKPTSIMELACMKISYPIFFMNLVLYFAIYEWLDRV